MKESVQEALAKGIEMHVAGQFELASKLYETVIKLQPYHADANHNMGLLKIDTGHDLEALPYLQTALETDTSISQFWVSYIKALLKLERIDEATRIFKLAKESGAQGNEFLELHQKLNEPAKIEVMDNSGGASGKKYKVQDPPQNQLQPLINLYSNGQLQKVLDILSQLLQQFPNSVILYNIQGAANAGLRQLDASVESYKQAIEIQPDYAEAYYNMGVVLQDQSKLEEAINAYNKALRIEPNYAKAHNNLGNTLKAQGKLEEAIEAYKTAVSHKLDYAEAYYNMGNALQEKGNLEEAIKAYNRALIIKPDCSQFYYNMGIVLQEQGKLKEAIEAYEKAIAIEPDYAEAYNNMGNALKEQDKLEDAIEVFNTALVINPGYQSARAQKLHLQSHICDWVSIEQDRGLIPELGISDQPVNPFYLIPLEDVPESHRLRSEVYSLGTHPQKPLPFKYKTSLKPKRLRIGYFSADFYNHPISFLIAQMLRLHDRDQFEVYAYAFGPEKSDDMTDRIKNSVDVFKDIRKLTDKDAALLARKDEIDVAIDLTGFTYSSRLGIFAHRAAPVQINYIACASTIGADFIDYIIADRFCIPQEYEKFYTESIIYLPNCYQVNDNTRVISERIFTRTEMSLPEVGFVFCTFNSTYKITSEEFDVWMRVLHKVEGSILWLIEANITAQQNLKREAEKRGINAERLVFAKKMPNREHLARHKLVDLFLDTFLVNAGATASDILWTGQPLITKVGKGFVTRIAGSLLSTIDVPELITKTTNEYEKVMLELALNPDRLATIKKKIEKNRFTKPLFNTELFTHHLEDGLRKAHQLFTDGNPKSHIFVEN